MSVSHHVTDDLLHLYATGELDFGWSLAVGTHLAMCPKCRNESALLDDVLGCALEEENIVPVSADIDVLIEKAEQKTLAPPPPPCSAQLANQPVLPQPLRDLTGDLSDIKWSTMGGGIKQKIIYDDNGVSARLLYIPPNMSASEHGHGGTELTQVLVGGFYDKDKAFYAGDIQIVDHEEPHLPTAMSDGPCICLAVTDAPLRFSNLLPRLFQRFFRI